MRFLLLLSALLVALSGTVGSARAAVGVERGASLPAAVTSADATKPQIARVVGDAGWGVVAPAPIPVAWTIMPASPRWIERFRV